MVRFNHFNFNVLDIKKSLDFYDKALGLKTVREKHSEDGSFSLYYLGDGNSDFTLELTWLKDRTEPYDLGECEFHLAMETDDMVQTRKKHDDMGVVCYDNQEMGIYFIEDPDGYWIEIVPGA